MYYLLDNPPKRSQYRTTRSAKPTGCIVLHTTESRLDTTNPDTGPQNVARFIQGRSGPGSYHAIGGRDSIVKMVPYSYEAWQDGTGSNRWAIGLSLAMQAHTWPQLDPTHRRQLIDTFAAMAADAAEWLKDEHGIDVPAVRLTRAESEKGLPGFISHGDRDPTRRTDPGREFPWTDFLAKYAELSGNPTGDKMQDYQIEAVTRIQTTLDAAGYDLGPFGVDGDPGPATADAVDELATDLINANIEIDVLTAQLATANQDRAIGEAFRATLAAAGHTEDVT